jgi:hypothetical protein
MQDGIFPAVTILFIVMSLAYVVFCERVRWGEYEFWTEHHARHLRGVAGVSGKSPSIFRSILMTPIRTCRLESAHHKSPK